MKMLIDNVHNVMKLDAQLIMHHKQIMTPFINKVALEVFTFEDRKLNHEKVRKQTKAKKSMRKICNECGQKFNKETIYKNHMRTKHGR